MATVELVSHSWNYSRLLCLQLSSIWINPPRKHSLRVTVCYAKEDEKTAAMLDWFRTHIGTPLGGSLLEAVPPLAPRLRPIIMAHDDLMRRGIGRNIVARHTKADFVFFSDCDMLFGPNAIDTLVDKFPADALLCFPRTVRKCTMVRGDYYIDLVKRPGVYDIEPADFEPHRYRRAIGGTQYIPGDLAREKGYLPEGHRYLKPAGRWMKTNEDVCARAYLAGHRGVAIDAPNIFRIRHTEMGRHCEGVEN